MPDGSGRKGFHVSPPGTNNTGTSPCDPCSVNRLRYLDDQLEGRELEEFRFHLSCCSDCRAHLEEEKALSRLLLRSRPLYLAPASLRARISAATEALGSLSTGAADGSHQISDGVDTRRFRVPGPHVGRSAGRPALKKGV